MKKLIFTLVTLLTLATSAFAEIGSSSADLVFTPIYPCRIVDTRGVGAGGVIPSAGTRAFKGWAASYSNQGGSATNCGLPQTTNIAALAVNLLVISPMAEGWIAAWPVGGGQPNVSNLNYKAGDVLANSAILKISQSTADFNIYTVSATHLAVDVTGYYSMPVATALVCNDSVSANLTIAAGATGSISSPACLGNAMITGGGCTSSTYDGRVVSSRAYSASNVQNCAWRNEGTAAMVGVAIGYCCILPGRP